MIMIMIIITIVVGLQPVLCSVDHVVTYAYLNCVVRGKPALPHAT